jgi:hypothetical protein
VRDGPPQETGGGRGLLSALLRAEHRGMAIAYARKRFHRSKRLAVERLVQQPDDIYAAKLVAKSAARQKDWAGALKAFKVLHSLEPSEFSNQQILRTAVYSSEWDEVIEACTLQPILIQDRYVQEIMLKKLLKEDPEVQFRVPVQLANLANLPLALLKFWVGVNNELSYDTMHEGDTAAIVAMACDADLEGLHWAIEPFETDWNEAKVLERIERFGTSVYFGWAARAHGHLNDIHAAAFKHVMEMLDDDAIMHLLGDVANVFSVLDLLDSGVIPSTVFAAHQEEILALEHQNLPHKLTTLVRQGEANQALSIVQKVGPHLNSETTSELLIAIAEVLLLNGYHEESRSVTSRLVLQYPTTPSISHLYHRSFSELRLHQESLLPGEIVTHTTGAATSAIEAHADNLVILDQHEMAEALLQPIRKLNRRGHRLKMHYRYYVQEDYEEVIRHHETMILTYQMNSEFACHCALSHAALGNLKQALEVLKPLTDAGEANACFTGFEILRQRGKKKQALAMVNRSLTSYGFEPISDSWAKHNFDLQHLATGPVNAIDDERLVTVIMTAHKDNPMMHKAVTSILDQSYTNLELLIIDDASAPEDVAVYESFLHDSRVSILRMPENSGTYAGKNHGLKHANGEFITFMDSDDWQHPQKIEKIIARLDKDPDSIAAFDSYVRLMPDGELAQVGSWFVRKCLMGLVWKRQPLLEVLGGFDEVRVSADSELLERAEVIFGKQRIIHTPVASYIATYHRQSLTGGGPFSIGWRGVRGARGQYVANFRAWHARNQNNVEALRISPEDTGGHFPSPDEMPRARHGHDVMPIVRESFDWIPKDVLNLHPQPVHDQGPTGPITVCMATFPARFKQTPEAVASLLEQSMPPDRIMIYVNEADAVPGLPDDPRIEVFGSEDVNLTDIGKFEVASMVEDGIVLTVDDDIWYPPNYVEKMVSAVQRYGGKAIVGVHGCVLPVGPAVSTWDEYRENRRVHWFRRAVSTDLPVNIVGTGTMAYDARQVRFDHRTYATGRMVDIHVAVEAQQKGYPMITPPRLREWMVPIEPDEGDSAESIWDMVRTDETMQSDIISRINDVRSWTLNVPGVGMFEESCLNIFPKP